MQETNWKTGQCLADGEYIVTSNVKRLLSQVHWVQCDKCELWYHLFCIGLKPHDIKEDEDFVCKFCKGVSRGGGGSCKKPQNDTSASDMDTE